MAQPKPPAAYLRAAQGSAPGTLARQHAAVTEAAHRRGWPAPMVYADHSVPHLADGYGPALARLEAAISAGRHGALLLAGPATVSGNPARLMRLLSSCTKQGIAVEILGPPAPHNSQTMPASPRASRSGQPHLLDAAAAPTTIGMLPASPWLIRR